MFVFLYIDVNIELAATDNESCSNPIAIYFDKANRERCLRLAAEKKSAVVQKIAKTFDENVDAVIKKTKEVKKEIENVENYYDKLERLKVQEKKEKLERARDLYNNVYQLVQKIRNDYKENQEGLVKLVDDYQNTFEYNQKIMKELASQIFKKLVANTFTKNYGDKRSDMVESYDKIRQFLATFSKEDDIPELPRDARKGKK
jgi:DNA repair ATPase RecN